MIVSRSGNFESTIQYKFTQWITSSWVQGVNLLPSNTSSEVIFFYIINLLQNVWINALWMWKSWTRELLCVAACVKKSDYTRMCCVNFSDCSRSMICLWMDYCMCIWVCVCVCVCVRARLFALHFFLCDTQQCDDEPAWLRSQSALWGRSLEPKVI